MRNQGESSVEEILDSIKKVIARDNRDGAIEERRRRSHAGIKPTPAFDEIDADTPELADADEAEEVLELSAAEITDAEITDAEITGGKLDDDRAGNCAASRNSSQNGCEDDSPLTGAAMQQSIRDNFAALSMLAQPGAQPQIVRSGETSLEGLARETLRPMLAHWLDANLPDMVERLVKDEITRIAGKGR